MKKFFQLIVFVCAFLIVSTAYASSTPSPQRIISASGALTEVIYALNAQNLLVAVDITSTYPQAAQQLPKVGYQRALSAEGILSLNPDLIFLTNESGPLPVIQQIQSTGVRVVEISAGRSVQDVKNSIQTIADVLGRQAEAKILLAKIDQEQEKLANLKKTTRQKPKVMFILQHGGSGPMVAGRGTAAESIIALSGGENVVTHYQGYKPLTPEAAVALAPDIILVTREGLMQNGGKQALLKNDAIALTPAGKNGHLIAMDSMFLLGFGPRTVEAAISLNHGYQDL